MSHFNLRPLLSLSFRNLFNKHTGHWVVSCVTINISIWGAAADPESHTHLSFVDVITVPRYGGRDGDCYYRLSPCRQFRQWAEEQNTQRHWKWSTNVCSSYCRREFSMHLSSKHEGQYQKSFWWKHSPAKKKIPKIWQKSINEEARQHVVPCSMTSKT